MCPACDGYAEVTPIRKPSDYFDLLRQIRDLLARGTLRLESGSCDLAELRPGARWPDDHLEHVFACAACGQRFRLGVETYHGSGGEWEPVG